MSDHVVETKQKRNPGEVKTHRKEGPSFELRDSVRCAAKGNR